MRLRLCGDGRRHSAHNRAHPTHSRRLVAGNVNNDDDDDYYSCEHSKLCRFHGHDKCP